MILPFFDHAIHFRSVEFESDLFSTRITRGDSFPGGFATLQILKSPLEACVANMSDFCFEEDACQASDKIGEGPREVVREWRMVNWGWRFAIRIDPFWYLVQNVSFLAAMQFQCSKYPIAYVRQSVAGARAVIGSKIVRAEVCSEVGGSNRITSPFPFPGASISNRVYSTGAQAISYRM